jgi:hypothetical protein
VFALDLDPELLDGGLCPVAHLCGVFVAAAVGVWRSLLSMLLVLFAAFETWFEDGRWHAVVSALE